MWRSWALNSVAHPHCNCLGWKSIFLDLIPTHNEANPAVSCTFSLRPVSIGPCLNFTLITSPSLSDNIPPWPISLCLSICALWSDVGEKGCALMSRDMQCSTLNGRLTSLSPSTLNKKMTSTRRLCYKGSLTLFWSQRRTDRKKNWKWKKKEKY